MKKKRDTRKGGRVILPRPGTRFIDRKKAASKKAARGRRSYDDDH